MPLTYVHYALWNCIIQQCTPHILKWLPLNKSQHILVASLEFKWNLGWPLLWPCPPCRPDQESLHSPPTASSCYWSRSAWSPQPRLRPCTGVQRTERDNHTLPLHCIQHTLPRIRKCQLSHLLLFVIISKGRKCNLQSIPGIIFDAVSCILGSNYVLISKG